MNEGKENKSIVINSLINFFQSLAGNRSMPRLFPNEFKGENLREYKNKAQQLAYLFD